MEISQSTYSISSFVVNVRYLKTVDLNPNFRENDAYERFCQPPALVEHLLLILRVTVITASLIHDSVA